MNIKFKKSVLMSGDDFPLTNDIKLHHPTIREFLSLGNCFLCEEVYWTYVQTLLCDPYSNMVMLDDMNKNFMETSPFEVFIIQWESYKTLYEKNKKLYDMQNINPFQPILNAMNFFICEEHDFTLVRYEDGSPCIVDLNNVNCQINEEIFGYIHEWIKDINKVDYSERINPADENARMILIEDARAEIKKNKKNYKKKTEDDTDYIGGLMSAVTFGGNGVITPFNLKDCKMYWLFEAFNIEGKKSNASHILDGLYHGTLSSKEINKNELDWTK